MTRKAQLWNMSSIISSNCNSNNYCPPPNFWITLYWSHFLPHPSFQRDKQQCTGKVLLTFAANNNHSPVSRYGGSATFSPAELKISQAWKSFIKRLTKNVNLIFQHFKFTQMQPGGQVRTGVGGWRWDILKYWLKDYGTHFPKTVEKNFCVFPAWRFWDYEICLLTGAASLTQQR